MCLEIRTWFLVFMNKFLTSSHLMTGIFLTTVSRILLIYSDPFERRLEVCRQPRYRRTRRRCRRRHRQPQSHIYHQYQT